MDSLVTGLGGEDGRGRLRQRERVDVKGQKESNGL
jgi:hypothetical protein